MKYKRQHKQSYNIINSFSSYYPGKTETILNYKCTFGLIEGKNPKCCARAITRQHEQYKSIVHLFIGTGHSLCEITFMPFMFTIDLRTIYRGLDNLFLFKSVPFTATEPKLPCAQLRSNSNLHHDHAFYIVHAFNPSPKVPVHLSHLEDIVKSSF